MILDRLDLASRYESIHPGFAAGFEYLRSTNLIEMAAGRHEVDRDRMYVVINREVGRGRDGAKFESHRRYIDIQLTLSGTDEIAWRALSDCHKPTSPFDVAKDYVLYDDPKETWLIIPPGSFAIFYPEDVHAPLGASCELIKAVLKVAVDW